MSFWVLTCNVCDFSTPPFCEGSDECVEGEPKDGDKCPQCGEGVLGQIEWEPDYDDQGD